MDTASRRYSSIRKIRYETDDEVFSSIIEFTIYIIFLALATILCLSVRHSYMFFYNDTFNKFFIERPIEVTDDKSLSFNELVTWNDFWDYMTICFINVLYSNNQNQSVENELTRRGYFLDENMLIGPPRLRQLRVKNTEEFVRDWFRPLLYNIYPPYATDVEDTTPYFKGTTYYTLKQLDALPLSAKIATYYGGGYVQNLSFDKNTSTDILENLRSEDWIDRASRAAIMEFNLHNKNTDILKSVKLIVEFVPVAGIVTSAKSRTIKIYSFFNDPNISMKISFIGFYVLIVYYAVQEIYWIQRLGRNYFHGVVFLMDWSIILIAIIALFYNCWHHIYVRRVLAHIAESKKFFSLERLEFWNMVYMDMIGIMIFLVWIKIFRYIGFNKTLLQFTTTIKRCTKDLLGFGLMFSIVFIAYAQVGVLIFGHHHPDFTSYSSAVLTLVRMLLADFQYSLIEATDKVLGPIFFLSYILIVFFILINMFLAIIIETYNSVKEELADGRLNLFSYIAKKFRRLYIIICRCGRPPQKRVKTVRPDIEEVMPERALSLRKSQFERKNRYLDDVPPETDNKEMYRLKNRISLLEEVLGQLTANMENLLNRYEAIQKH